MPISNAERQALQDLLAFTIDECVAVGYQANSLQQLQALNDNRMAEYQATIDAERVAVLQLIANDVTGTVHDFWQAAQDGVWARLNATGIDLVLLITSADLRVKTMLKSLPVLASLRITLANFEAG